MRKIPFAIILLVSLGSASAPHAWEVVQNWQDPISGRTVTAAVHSNNSEFAIQIFRDSDDRVRAVYSIPQNSFDRVSREGRVLAIRPDDHDVSEMVASVLAPRVGNHVQSDGRNIRGVLWHGQDSTPAFGTLRNILDSEILMARFYTDTGSHFETSWSLTGAPQAISLAIGIEVEVDPEKREREEQRMLLMTNATKRCSFDIPCLQQITMCFDYIITPAFDVSGFDACVLRTAP